jgi:hypothetical protein
MEYTTKEIELTRRDREVLGVISGTYTRVDEPFLRKVAAWALEDATREECKLYTQLSQGVSLPSRLADIVFESPRFQDVPTAELIELTEQLEELRYAERDFIVI